MFFVAAFARSRSTTWMPVHSARMRSRMMTSGWYCLAKSIALLPFGALSTHMPFIKSVWPSNSSNAGSSSTTRAVLTSLPESRALGRRTSSNLARIVIGPSVPLGTGPKAGRPSASRATSARGMLVAVERRCFSSCSFRPEARSRSSKIAYGRALFKVSASRTSPEMIET